MGPSRLRRVCWVMVSARMSAWVIVINRGRSSWKGLLVCDYSALATVDKVLGRCGCGHYQVSVTFEIKMAVCDMQSLTLNTGLLPLYSCWWEAISRDRREEYLLPLRGGNVITQQQVSPTVNFKSLLTSSKLFSRIKFLWRIDFLFRPKSPVSSPCSLQAT